MAIPWSQREQNQSNKCSCFAKFSIFVQALTQEEQMSICSLETSERFIRRISAIWPILFLSFFPLFLSFHFLSVQEVTCFIASFKSYVQFASTESYLDLWVMAFDEINFRKISFLFYNGGEDLWRVLKETSCITILRRLKKFKAIKEDIFGAYFTWFY